MVSEAQRPFGVTVAGGAMALEGGRHMLFGTMVYHGLVTGSSSPTLLMLVFSGLSIALAGTLAIATYGVFMNGNWARGLGGGGLLLIALLSIGYVLLTGELVFAIEAAVDVIVAGYLFSGRSEIKNLRPEINDSENSQTFGLP